MEIEGTETHESPAGTVQGEAPEVDTAQEETLQGETLQEAGPQEAWPQKAGPQEAGPQEYGHDAPESEPEPQASESEPEPQASESEAEQQSLPAMAFGESDEESGLSADELLGETEPEESSARIDDERLKAVLEAIIYVTDEPLTLDQISIAIEQPKARVAALLEELASDYEKPERGLSIKVVAGGFKMATKPEHHDAVRRFVKNLNPPLKLSLPALETLAVIAYKQPITAPEIMEIRGVQGAGVLKTLLDRKLIVTGGRKQVVGKPILYKTTKEFLVQFGLRDLSELPTLKEFQEIGRMDTGVAEAAEPLVAGPPIAEPPSEAPPSEAPPEQEPPSQQPPEGDPTPAEPPVNDPVEPQEPAAPVPPFEEPPAPSSEEVG